MALIIVMTAAALGCRGNGTKPALTPTPEPAPTATAAPRVVGPVLVYSFETPFAQRQGNPELTVVAFDAGTWHELHRTVLPSLRVMSPRLSAHGLLFYIFNAERAADPQELRSLDPVTGEVRTLYSTARGLEYSIALSPDGSMVAFSEADRSNYPAPADVRVLDVASAAVRTIVTFTPQNPAGFVGTPVPMVWRDDGRGFVVLGATGTDAGGYATVMLDGTVVIHRERDAMYLAPGGHYGATGGYGESWCRAFDRTQRLELFDFDTNTVVNSVDDPQRGLFQRAWSPAGDQLLYKQMDVAEVKAYCDRTAPDPPGRAFLLSVHGGPPVPVDDVAALRRQWYGDRIIDFQCGGETAFNPYGDCIAYPGRMLLNGREVASGDVIHAVGFIEPHR